METARRGKGRRGYPSRQRLGANTRYAWLPNSIVKRHDASSHPNLSIQQDAQDDAKVQPGPSLVRYVIGNAGALVVGLVAAYFGLVLSGAGNALVLSIKTVDFMTYYSAALLILQGHGAHLYDWQTIGHLQLSLVYPYGRTFGILPYLYPPYLAIALVPLSILPYSAAYLAWLVLDCIMLAGAMFLLERHAGLTGRRALVLRLAALSFFPVFMALGLGQVSIVLLALFTGSTMALHAGKPRLGGALLAIALIKPFYGIPFLVVLAVRRQWAALAACFGTAVCLLMVSLPIFGPHAYAAYVGMLQEVGRWQGYSAASVIRFHHFLVASSMYAAQWNHSMAGFTELLLQPGAAELTTVIVDAGLLLILAWCALAASSIDLPLGMAVIVATLISPHTLAYDLTLLLIPVAVALRYRYRSRRLLVAVLAGGYLLIPVGYRLVFLLPFQLSVVAMLVLLAWLVRAVHRDGSERRQNDERTRLTCS